MKVKVSKSLCVVALMGIFITIAGCNQTDNTTPASVNSPGPILTNPTPEYNDSSNVNSSLTVEQTERDSVIKGEQVNKDVLTIKPECPTR